MISSRRLKNEHEQYAENARKLLQDQIDILAETPDSEEAIVLAERLDAGLDWEDPRKEEVRERLAHLANWKVAKLWQAAKTGDIDSLNSLTNLTTDRRINDPFDEYSTAWYTAMTKSPWTVPDEYYDVVSTIVELPDISLLRITRKPSPIDLHIAVHDTMAEPTLLKAKSVVALWRNGHDIPLSSIERILSIVTELHKSMGLFQEDQTIN